MIIIIWFSNNCFYSWIPSSTMIKKSNVSASIQSLRRAQQDSNQHLFPINTQTHPSIGGSSNQLRKSLMNWKEAGTKSHSKDKNPKLLPGKQRNRVNVKMTEKQTYLNPLDKHKDPKSMQNSNGWKIRLTNSDQSMIFQPNRSQNRRQRKG